MTVLRRCTLDYRRGAERRSRGARSVRVLLEVADARRQESDRRTALGRSRARRTRRRPSKRSRRSSDCLVRDRRAPSASCRSCSVEATRRSVRSSADSRTGGDDLSRSAQITVVERDRLQALLAEMRISQAADSGSVRLGRILQAGRLVGGNILQLGANQLRADAFLLNVQTAQTQGTAATDQQPIDQLFTLEKNVVLRLFADMGVTLTTARAKRDRATADAVTRRVPGVQSRPGGAGRCALRRRRAVLRQCTPSRPQLSSGAAARAGNEEHRRREQCHGELDRVRPPSVRSRVSR